jgi:predicted DNA-binding protein
MSYLLPTEHVAPGHTMGDIGLETGLSHAIGIMAHPLCATDVMAAKQPKVRNGKIHTSIWLDVEHLDRLRKLGETDERDMAYMVNRAIRDYVEAHSTSKGAMRIKHG